MQAYLTFGGAHTGNRRQIKALIQKGIYLVRRSGAKGAYSRTLWRDQMWPWKKKPSVPLPNAWTPGLWQELMNGQKKFQCFLGIDKYDVTVDFNYGNHQPGFTRSYGGFIGGPETSPVRQLRASLSFTTRSSEWVFANHPAESNGYGQTNQWYDMPPCLCFTVFAAPETESIFEDLFVRAKLIGIPYLAVNIWADVLEDRPAGDSNEFIRVLNITRIIFQQHPSLRGPIPQESPSPGDF